MTEDEWHWLGGVGTPAEDEFSSVYTRKVKVNAGKSKVMVFERMEEVVDFNTPYSLSVPVVGRCEVILRGERM